MRLLFADDASVKFGISKDIYSLSVIHKCFYWFGDKHVVDIDSEENLFIVHVVLKDGSFMLGDIERLFNRIKESLIDFKTREIVSAETKNIREVLIAKAFAHGDEFDEIPQGDISDPIGFNPENF